MGDWKKNIEKVVGPTSSMMSVSSKRDVNLKSYFDKIDEIEAGIDTSSLQQIVENNHDVATNRRKIGEQLPMERFFGFRRNFE